MADKYVDLTLERASKLAMEDGPVKDLLRDLAGRVASVRQEHDFFRLWCDRADALYYADTFTGGGADLWPTDKSATTNGRSHVSVNLPAAYVNIPASMEAVAPIENMLATDTTMEARDAAAKLERLYVAWKHDQDFELKFHKATTIKGLYGRTAGRVTLDRSVDTSERDKPAFEVIEQPRNLWLGYKTDSYTELEWAAYCLRYEPNALMETYGVDLGAHTMEDGNVVPTVGDLPQAMQFDGLTESTPRVWLNFGAARIEVWDYWYRRPVSDKRTPGKKVKMVTCNAVFAGNALIQGPTEYPEYHGKLPYVVLFNTFIPGVPNGRPELWDAEPLIREKMEKITAGAQMIANGVAGDYWQLVGPEAPTRVPASLKPKRNELVGPGPGNRIETITPFIMQFQLEQFLGRLDRELAAITGLNDLILGLAPAQVLSSSKAINALIANYEARISMPRKLLYSWRRAIWELVVEVWAEVDKEVKAIVAAGAGVLEIIDPSLSPRDDMETATRAINLMNAKLISQRRGMDMVGVDDPETEQDLIREERTDATMFPADVEVMAQLLGILQSMGVQAPGNVQGQAGAMLGSGQNDLRKSLGVQTPDNSTSSQLPGDQGIPPPMPMGPSTSGGPGGPDMGALAAAQQGSTTQMQGMIQNGQSSGRILTNTKLAKLGRR